jgi:hypothetical protein
VQAWIEVHWEDPQRLEPIRIPAQLIPINAPPSEDCTLEAMRTQACPNQCLDFKWLLFAQHSIISSRIPADMFFLPRPVVIVSSDFQPPRAQQATVL